MATVKFSCRAFILGTNRIFRSYWAHISMRLGRRSGHPRWPPQDLYRCDQWRFDWAGRCAGWKLSDTTLEDCGPVLDAFLRDSGADAILVGSDGQIVNTNSQLLLKIELVACQIFLKLARMYFIFAFSPTVSTTTPGIINFDSCTCTSNSHAIENYQHTFTFERSHELWYSHVWWDIQQKMDVVWACFALYYFLFLFFAQLYIYFYNTLAHCFVYDLSPALWCEYYMVFAPITGMGRMFHLIFHLRNISLPFRDAVSNHLDCNMEVLFAKAFSTPPVLPGEFFAQNDNNPSPTRKI